MKSIWQLIERNKRVSLRTSAVYIRYAVLWALIGFFFLMFTYVFRGTNLGELQFLFLGFAGLFFIGAVFNLVNAKKMKALKAETGKAN